MGLRLIDLQVIERIRQNLPKQGARALALGYPDVLLEEGELRELFDLDGAEFAFREDSAQIIKWHGAKIERVVEAKHFFSLLGMDLDVWDIHASRGIELEVDLNHALTAPNQSMRYDLVIDCGTIEHCFNIGQAMASLAIVTREGGFVFHDNPCNMYNHGFYNLNPTFYHDWYEANGFVVTLCALTDGKNYLPVAPKARFAKLPDGMSLVCVARKLTHQLPVWPMQAKYRDNPELRA